MVRRSNEKPPRQTAKHHKSERNPSKRGGIIPNFGSFFELAYALINYITSIRFFSYERIRKPMFLMWTEPVSDPGSELSSPPPPVEVDCY